MPRHTWKVVFSRGDGRSWAYWMMNTNEQYDLKPIEYGNLSDFQNWHSSDLRRSEAA